MAACPCTQAHEPRRIVLTGGPGAGKTATLGIMRHYLCKHVTVLPEAASVVFRGGFPRGADPEVARAAQRAIFYLQREIETATLRARPALVVCDRGTIDGAAYWPGDGDLFSAVGTTLEEQLARYDTVIHLRTPSASNGYGHTNPLRIETAEQAAEIDERIARAWARHPRRFVVDAIDDFLAKAMRAITIVCAEIPPCCQHRPTEGGTPFAIARS